MVGVLFTLVLAFQGKEPAQFRPTWADFVGVWQSHFYGEATHTLLTIKEDGTFSFSDGAKGGRWIITDDRIDFKRGDEDGWSLRMNIRGDRLSDNIPDGTTYFRYMTVQIEEALVGLWSTEKFPKPGITPTSIVFESWSRTYRQGKAERKSNVVRDHIEFEMASGKIVNLWPSNDFNKFSEGVPNGITITRVASLPLAKAVLGEWSCGVEDPQSKGLRVIWLPFMFRSDGTYIYNKKKGTWKVEKDHIVIEKFKSATVRFKPLSKGGMRMESEKFHEVVLKRGY